MARPRILGALALTASAVGCGRHEGAVVAQVAPDSVRVPVLVYHNIAPHHPGQNFEQRELDVDSGVFAQQMRYIANQKYHVVSLDTLAAALEGGPTVPARSVVITFDDGWKGQYDHAFPLIKQLGFTATFFVYPSVISDGAMFMTWDQVRELQAAGMTIGDHSRTHPMLTDPRVSLPSEVDSSRADIQRQIGTRPDLFAYPYGASNDRVVAAVRSAGYRAARGLAGGAWNRPADLFELRSVLVTNDMRAFQRALGP